MQDQSAQTLLYFRPKWTNSIPFFELKRLKKHTLWGRTYVHSLYKGVPAPWLRQKGERKPLTTKLVLQFPPRLSCNSRVSEEFLYGMWVLLPSDRACIVLLQDKRKVIRLKFTKRNRKWFALTHTNLIKSCNDFLTCVTIQMKATEQCFPVVLTFDRVCGGIPKGWPFKWNLLSRTFVCWCLLYCIRRFWLLRLWTQWQSVKIQIKVIEKYTYVMLLVF